MKRYIVEVANEGGTIGERDCGADFDLCLTTARGWREKYGRGVAIVAYNADGCDVDADGLTSDERDALMDADVLTRAA